MNDKEAREDELIRSMLKDSAAPISFHMNEETIEDTVKWIFEMDSRYLDELVTTGTVAPRMASNER